MIESYFSRIVTQKLQLFQLDIKYYTRTYYIF